ncbi:MAG: HNH endonuclease [Thiomonas arsenitoxydans]|nr:HNH endonuclease [Thiomonas arsenitoxydans]
MSGLYVDLVPQTAWYDNLRALLQTDEWDAVRRAVYRRAGHRCQICGGQGEKWPVEAHERWAFDDAAGVQSLRDIEALCPACHTVTHFGLAEIRGKKQEAFSHLMRVNAWSADQARKHVDEAFATWQRRGQRRWSLDARKVFEFAELSLGSRQTIERFASAADLEREIAHAR